MNRRPTRRLAAALALAAGTCLSIRAEATTKTWIAPNGGTFSVGSNWLNLVAPISGDSAVFGLSDSYTVDFTSSVFNVGLIVRNDTVTFDLSGFTFTTTTGGLTGGSAGDISRLTITNGTLSLAGTGLTTYTLGGASGLRQTLTISTNGVLSTVSRINVGDTGEGSLIVLNGGTVNAGTIDLSRSAGAGAAGTMTVSGFGSSVTTSGLLQVAGVGQGVLNVTGGGTVSTNLLTVGQAPGAGGTVTISGADSVLTATSATIGATGTGFVRVDSGASFTTGSAVIAATNGAAGGSVVVDGPGSSWSSGQVTLGQGGSASLSITNGGHVSSSTVTLFGSAFVSGAGSRWTITSLSSADGGLEVHDGAVCTIGTVTIGQGGHDSILVSGPAAKLFNDDAVTLGTDQAGDLTVADRGTAFLATGTLGSNASGFGSLHARDPGSVISVPTLTVGGSGQGLVLAENGGQISVGSSTRLTVGLNANSQGTIRVSGPGSRLTAPNLVLGQSGGGDLIVENGGFVSLANTSTLNVGSSSTSHGDVTVSGPGSILSVGTLILGGVNIPGGIGALTLTDGGEIDVAHASTLTQNSSTTIDGGTINAPEGLIVNSQQTDLFSGLIDVGQTGTLTVNGRLALHSNAARIRAGLVDLNGATARLTGSGQIFGPLSASATGSEISVAGTDQLFVFGNGTLSGRLTLINGGLIDFGPAALTVNTTGRVSGRGTLKEATLTNNGTISLSGGSSDVFGAVTNNSTARVFVTGNSVATFYDNLTNNAGSVFQISGGSTAVFFGNVTGLGAFTGTGIKDFEGGVNVGGGLQTITGDTIVGGPALASANSVRERSLTLSGRLNVTPNGTNAAVSRLNELIVDGNTTPTGTLELNDNDLLVDYATSGEPSPLPMMQAQIAFARHGGAWDRAGITSSTAATQVSHATTLGILEGSSFRQIYGPSATFSGQSVDDTSVLVKYTWYGDSDFNGKVNFDDYVRIDNGFNNHLAGWVNGDFDLNGAVNFDDYVLIDLAFNVQSGTLGRALRFLDGSDRSSDSMDSPALLKVRQHFAQFGADYGQSLLAAVPEPGTTLCFASSAMGAAMMRRRHRCALRI